MPGCQVPFREKYSHAPKRAFTPETGDRGIVEKARVGILMWHRRLRLWGFSRDDKTRLKRQIDATDKEIDELFYELYGLTDGQIRIVEEATK